MSSEFYTHVSRAGNSILYRGVNSEGKRIKRKITYNPTLYLTTNKPSEWKTLDGTPLEVKEFKSIYDASAFVRRYKDIDNLKIYGNQRWVYTFIGETFPNIIEFDTSKVRIANIDIEVLSPNGFPLVDRAEFPVSAITVKVADKYWVWGLKDFLNKNPENVNYAQCNDEAELLMRFIEWWSQDHPDVITGWNVKLFDIPYLCNRITNVLGPSKASRLSPWGKIEIEMVDIGYKEVMGFKIDGIQIMDYYELYKKPPIPNRESYTLEWIAQVEELSITKIDYKAQGYLNLTDLYERNHQLYIEYNIIDVTVVDELEKKLGLLDLAMVTAYMTKVNYEDYFSQGRIWDANIYNKLRTMHIAVPPREHSTYSGGKIRGAYVKEPRIGKYRWVVSFDLTSLYPHLIMMYNMSPETLVNQCDHPEWFKPELISVKTLLNKSIDLSEQLKAAHLTMTPNGQLFKTDKRGMLAELMEEMFVERAKYKKKALAAKKEYLAATSPEEKLKWNSLAARYKAIEMALKICLNSAYGSIANEYFRYFDVRIAEGVTLSGQLSINWVQKAINEYFNKLLKTVDIDYVIASDTDSLYITLDVMMDRLVKDQSDTKKCVELIDKICEKELMPFIDKSFKELATYVNAYEQKMLMKREAIVDHAIWTGAKNYILSVHDSEGVKFDPPDIKVTGWGSARADKPKICRNKLKESMKVALYQDISAMRKFVDEFRVEFDKEPLMNISCPSGLNDMEKWEDSINIFKKGSPIHVRAALIHNHYLNEMGLQSQYKELSSNNKMRYVFLKDPNPFHSNVIGFMDEIPVEFELDKYIDRQALFNKTFLAPLEIVLDVIGWKLEEGGTLEDFFV